MSEQDRFDWNDDKDFESEADVQAEYEDFEDPLDGYDDFEDLSDDDVPATDIENVQAQAGIEEAEDVKKDPSEMIQAEPKVVVRRKKQKRRKGISAVGAGFLFSVSILVAGVGVGGAILLAEGVHPASLWRPKNLIEVDQLLNFADNPLNILYMVTMGIAFLALLGSYKMAKAAVMANERTREAEDMLEQVTALSLDKQEDWQSPVFKKHPPTEAFVIRTLGAWRLQAGRHKRLMGVEGELHRLEKALSKNSREDLTGRFDHPAVGRLADEMIRHFDARDAAVKKFEANESEERENSTECLGLLQESRQWNGATLDNLGVQCISLDELAGQMDNLAKHIEKAMAAPQTTEGMTDIIEGIRQDLATQSTGGMVADGTAAELNDLVDQGSKLAFKIAMEVARLGPRGERLLPMSQSLEDLTTGFRKLTDKVNGQGGNSGTTRAMKSVHQKLETLAALITQDDSSPWRDMADEVQDFGPAAARISGNFNGMADGFNLQEDRLVRLGQTLADMTGVEFDSSSIPRKESSDASVSSLDIVGQATPAKSEKPILGPTPTMPSFAQTESPFQSEVKGFAGSDNETKATGRGPAGVNRFSLNPEPPADMPLPENEEKVYDLEDFGASPAAELDTEDSEQVFDLSSFGAVPMAGGEDQGPDEVFELSDFDPVPLQDDVVDAEEEVYELSDFGASPLDLAMKSGSDEATPEDEVFDLSDFGAEPMI